jgi:hypothetical protein
VNASRIPAKSANFDAPTKPVIHIFLNGAASAMKIEAVVADVREEVGVASAQFPLRCFLCAGWDAKKENRRQ